ncbi:hypothetical protein WMY93_030991 [Mugilogobius chulae]|uniref:CBM21 domain-containing protein n=1 Tax=Mugilogobius chulae TaxID=88201 RepID=A0AAW0MNV3_9GOBI
MSFLTIPSQDSLFTAVKSGKSADDSVRFRTVDADEDDEDEEDDTDVRLIPRCSPIPRKRGSSIADETAEYMRIQLALSGGKRVSFADTTGGDLVDVKEFTAFDSDEEDSSKWEEEGAKYRHAQQVPNYHVRPEFSVPSADVLLKAVRTNKVEVEDISAVENDPLPSVGSVHQVHHGQLDSYYDHLAEYVQGSHDGDTDKFCFKLCFAAPYTTHGSRIEFVVRYETSEGDFWANNSKMNYVVTLLLSYDDSASEKQIDIRDVRSILKPPKVYRTEIDFELEDDENKIEVHAYRKEEEESTKSELVRPVAISPAIFQPELDVEIAVHSSSTVPPDEKLLSVDGAQSTHCETAQSLLTSCSVPLQTCLLSELQASQVFQPNNYSEQQEISQQTLCPPVSQESTQSPVWSQAEEDEGSCVLLTRDSPAPVSAAEGSVLQREDLSEECLHWPSPQFKAQSQTSGAQTVAPFVQQDCVDLTETSPSSETHTAPACRVSPSSETHTAPACRLVPDVFSPYTGV